MRDDYVAAARSRWLAEVAAALDEAKILAERLSKEPRHRAEHLELLARIETARMFTHTMRLRQEIRIRSRRKSETDETARRDP